jgi:hypothetical protein
MYKSLTFYIKEGTNADLIQDTKKTLNKLQQFSNKLYHISAEQKYKIRINN